MHCLNCNADLPVSARYCPACGQKVGDGRISVRDLLKEFFSEQLNLDGKFWNTVRASVIPGALTQQYFQGKRKSLVNPFRWFLLIALIPFILISLYGNFSNSSDFFLNPGEINRMAWFSHKSDAFLVLDSLESKLEKHLPDSTARQLRDSIVMELEKDLQIRSDSVDLNENFRFGFEDMIMKVSVRDFNQLTADELLDKYEVSNLVERIIYRQKIKLYQNPGSLLEFFLANTAWMILLFIPIVALILALLYIRHKRYFVEHLVFSLHQHTTAIFIITLFGIGHLIFTMDAWFIYGLIAFVADLLFAMKRYYQQGWIKTIIKFILINLLYPIFFSLFFAVASLASILLF